MGFRQGELDDGDGLATMVVALIGGPALLVGALLVTADGLTMGQVLLVAPIGALLGALTVGSSAAMAAQTGAYGPWLLRPAFGRGGAIGVSVLRLILVVLWAVVGLQLAGGWARGAFEDAGVALPLSIWVIAVAVVGLILVLVGVVPTIQTVIRKPLFISSVLLLALLAWRLATGGFGFESAGTGAFWPGVQRAVEVAVVFIPFVEVVARRLHNDEDAMSSFGVGYAVPATLMFAAGAVLAFRLGGIGDLMGLDVGAAGVSVVVAWVLIAEVDQAFAGFVAAGSEAAGIVRIGPSWVVGAIASLAVVGVALLAPNLPIGMASLAAAVVFPTAVISMFDFHLVKDHYYAEADMYGRTESLMNMSGIGCWLAAAVFGQLLDPIGPSAWTDLMPDLLPDVDLPLRLIVTLAAATAYLLITRWGGRRTPSVYEVRGVNVYGRQHDE